MSCSSCTASLRQDRTYVRSGEVSGGGEPRAVTLPIGTHSGGDAGHTPRQRHCAPRAWGIKLETNTDQSPRAADAITSVSSCAQAVAAADEGAGLGTRVRYWRRSTLPSTRRGPSERLPRALGP